MWNHSSISTLLRASSVSPRGLPPLTLKKKEKTHSEVAWGSYLLRSNGKQFCELHGKFLFALSSLQHVVHRRVMCDMISLNDDASCWNPGRDWNFLWSSENGFPFSVPFFYFCIRVLGIGRGKGWKVIEHQWSALSSTFLTLFAALPRKKDFSFLLPSWAGHLSILFYFLRKN
jgi:hypothetical protein